MPSKNGFSGVFSSTCNAKKETYSTIHAENTGIDNEKGILKALSGLLLAKYADLSVFLVTFFGQAGRILCLKARYLHYVKSKGAHMTQIPGFVNCYL